ncbi:MAG: HEPN domain-containing protein [Candidatus Gastranaerophilales bacterium]|nr:HEPN domain-containing protein [Candidatus Gastranaerophilales bacterium]
MPFDEYIKAKSDENWKCAKILGQEPNKHFNAATSRMYYSIFLLVKSVMVRNNENPALPDVTKMTMDASTGVHQLAADYLNYIDYGLGRCYQKLISLREKADYDPAPITQKEFEEAFAIWLEKRNEFVSNLKNYRRLYL